MKVQLTGILAIISRSAGFLQLLDPSCTHQRLTTLHSPMISFAQLYCAKRSVFDIERLTLSAIMTHIPAAPLTLSNTQFRGGGLGDPGYTTI